MILTLVNVAYVGLWNFSLYMYGRICCSVSVILMLRENCHVGSIPVIVQLFSHCLVGVLGYRRKFFKYLR